MNSAVQNNFEHMFANPPQFNLVMGDDRRAPSRRCCEEARAKEYSFLIQWVGFDLLR